MPRSLISRLVLVIPGWLLLASSLHGQLKSDLPPAVSSTNLKSVASTSWLDPQRFTMNHGFSVSLIGGAGLGPGATSLSVYTNAMRYIFTNNLVLNSRIHLVQPGGVNPYQPGGNDLLIYYQAGMDWRPLRNLNIHIGISNLPAMRRYPVWNYGRYTPYLEYQPADHPETVDP